MKARKPNQLGSNGPTNLRNATVAECSTADEVSCMLTTKDLCARLQLSKRTISRMISSGDIPEPIYIGRNVRWRVGDIEQWIEQGCPSINNRR